MVFCEFTLNLTLSVCVCPLSLQIKSALREEEAVSSDVVGQAHIETVALRLFEFADAEDRAARFTR